MLEHEDKWEDALRLYVEFLAYDPTNYDLRISIGQIQRLLGNHSQSIQIFSNLLKEDPLSGKLNFELAKSHYADGNRNKALEQLEIVMDIWENADPIYKSTIEVREKWVQWNQVK